MSTLNNLCQKTGGEAGIRTRDQGLSPVNGLANRCTPDVTAEKTGTSAQSPDRLAALLGAFAAEIGPKAPDLAAVVSAWPGLPEALRARIVAMVKAAGETPAK
ncbi:MAG: hypothetical protein IMZ44_12000 [Planctomycetes bacterium]|nr:hypothetical protein [Planctomycetota bacterium]